MTSRSNLNALNSFESPVKNAEQASRQLLIFDPDQSKMAYNAKDENQDS